MYELSTKINALHRALEKLTGFHSYRYKHFVDSSPHGEACKYAITTKKYYELEHEREGLYHLLVGMRDRIDIILEEHLNEAKNNE
jgi:hypothetical protein